MLTSLLEAFLMRLACGLALALAVTPASQVVSAFFRVHLWVLLGLFTFAAVATFDTQHMGFVASVVGAVLSYFGAVIWLYDRRQLGRMVIWLVAATAFWGLLNRTGHLVINPLVVLDEWTSSLLLGFTVCAMLLGHWYLNTPTMQLGPLRRLLLILGASVVLRAAVAGVSVWQQPPADASSFGLAILALRWLAGIIGVGVVAVMSWMTLRIPNTQSATGILYVGVILAFIGEMAAHFPQ